MFDLDLALRFGAALGLGLLLGLERERKRDAELLFGGVRTFALIALLGAVGAFVERELHEGWLVLAAFIALSALVLVSYMTTASRGELGITTEITALLAFIVGVLCSWDRIGVASVTTVVCLLLLTLKDYLHRLARRVELADVEATLAVRRDQRDHSATPAQCDVWPGASQCHQSVQDLADGRPDRGVEFSRLRAGQSAWERAWTPGDGGTRRPRVQHGRHLELLPAQPAGARHGIGMRAGDRGRLDDHVPAGRGDGRLVNASLAAVLGLPLGLMAAGGVLVSLVLWRRTRSQETGVVTAGANPFELGEAIKFGLLFGVVTVVAKAAEVYMGETGLYLAGAVAGLTDVDAISLSMANLATADAGSLKVAARTIVIAVLSNTLVKTGMAVFVGTPALRRTLLLATLLVLIAAAVGAVIVGRGS